MEETRLLLLDGGKRPLQQNWDELKDKGISVTTVQELADCLATLEYDRDYVVVIDADLYRQGIEAVQEIAKISPDIIVLVLVSVERLSVADEMLKHGARDFILKQPDLSHFHEIPQAIARNMEQKRLQSGKRRSRQEAQWFMAALWGSRDGFFVAEPEGKIIFANPALCDRLGYHADELIGKSMNLFLASIEMDPTAWVEVSQPIPHRRCPGRIVLKKKEGSELPIASQMVEILGEEGEAKALVVSCFQREETKGQALTSAPEVPGDGVVRNEILMDIVEDVKSPLAALMGYLEITSSINPERVEPNQHLSIRRIEILARRLLDLVSYHARALDIEAGKFEINLSPLQINRMVEIAIEDKTSEAEAKNIDIIFETDKRIQPRLFDALQLERAFGIILSNALGLSPIGGTVKVSTRLNGKEIAVDIKDSGAGVSQEEIPFLFDRKKKFRKRGAEVNTIGLYVAKHIVAAQGGRIEVQSDPVEGTTFTVYFPIS
jgi:PAS domain S-box-containing protein